MKLIMENWREFILNEVPSTGKWVGCPENHYRDPKTGRCKSMINTGFAFVPAGAVAQAITRAAPALARSKETLAMLAAVVSQQVSDLISNDASKTLSMKDAIASVVKDVVKNHPKYQEDEEEDDELNCAFASSKMLEVTTELDQTTRPVVIVTHPDQTTTAYFKSSGVSGTGAEGTWVPFEGWATNERVPKGQSYGNGAEKPRKFSDGEIRYQPYGAYALMAKTFFGLEDQGLYPFPPGSKYELCSRWLSRMESSGELMKLTKVYMTIESTYGRDGWLNTYPKYAKLNKSLKKFGAIDQNTPALKPNAKGRRLLFGVDEIS